MGQPREPYPVKLIFSLFSQRKSLFGEAEKILIRKFGVIDYQSRLLDFNHTQYYQNEFGTDLKRKFISFKKLIWCGDLYKIKIFSNKIEDEFSKEKKRRINIDPGYISQANLILASTKNYSHRIYIKKGIYQEVALIFKNKAFQALPWTYPDYQSKECLDVFIQIRSILSQNLNEKISHIS